MACLVKFIEAGSRMWFPEAGSGERNGKLVFSGYRISVLQNEKSSGDGGGVMVARIVDVLNATNLYP